MGIEHVLVRTVNDEITSMMKRTTVLPEGALRGLRFIAIGISSNLKQLIYQTVQREFVGLSPCIRLMEEALQENACSAFLHSKLDVKKAWNVPPLHAADPSGMASDARLNIRNAAFRF